MLLDRRVASVGRARPRALRPARAPVPEPGLSQRVRSLVVMLATAITIAVPGCSAPAAPAAGPAVGSPATGSTEVKLQETAAPSVLLDPLLFAAVVGEPGRTTINVHVPFEGSIEGTDASIPFDQISTETARLPADRGTPLAIYCRSGRMSAIAAAKIAGMGYRDVVELRGGMEAWAHAGLALSGASGGGAR